MDDAARAILDFWFGVPGKPEHGTSRTEWFRKRSDFDAEIARRFGPAIEQALAGGLGDWDRAAETALARILLLDQFTRNVFRDTPRAFSGDALAQDAARKMLAAGMDAALLPVQRIFVYLPLEHAEDLQLQDESVRLFTRLASDLPADDETLDYALRHHAVIARFGRFPHRNAILGRPSTDEEVEYLKQPGAGF